METKSFEMLWNIIYERFLYLLLTGLIADNPCEWNER